MAIEAFISEYFLQPLYAGDAVYNIYNTLVYAVVLVAAVFGVYKLLKQIDVKIDMNFFIALTPFVLLASVFRVIRDAAIFTSPVFVSPLIYFFVFGIAISILLVGVFIEKKYNYKYDLPVFSAGILLLIYFGRYISVAQMAPVIQTLLILAVFTGMFFALNKIKPEFFSMINIYILSAAMFDAASTFIGISYYGYIEKHILPHFLVNIFGPWIMFPLKFAVIAIALYVIDMSEEDTYFKNFLKFAILTVTLAPGARNTLRMMMGV